MERGTVRAGAAAPAGAADRRGGPARPWDAGLWRNDVEGATTPRGTEAPPLAHGRDAEAVREYEETLTTVFIQSGLPKIFAFAGYARIATLGEEVRDPARTIPRAIPLAL
ncbi:hypothetical protein ABZ421_18955, partial [Streptomyces sp. NPDC005859]